MFRDRREKGEGIKLSLRSRKGDGIKVALSFVEFIGVISERDLDLGIDRTRSLLSEQVSHFYGQGRKVVCGLGFRGRLTCSVANRKKELQPTTRRPDNVSTTGI